MPSEARSQRTLFSRTIATQPPDATPTGIRRPRGAYYTPDALALAIARWLERDILDAAPVSVFEPGCGGGAFLRAAHNVWPQASLLGVDLVPACKGPGIIRKQDLFDPAIPPGVFDLVLGNPDFGMAEKVVRRSIELANPGGFVALLLRAGFEESAERVPLFHKYPLFARRMLAQRPCFTGDGGSDSTAYAVFVWRRGVALGVYAGFPPLVWR